MQNQQEAPSIYLWDGYNVCDVCGRENTPDEEPWSFLDTCPGCEADEHAHRYEAPPAGENEA